MTKDVLMNGIQTGKTIWHKSARGPGGGDIVDLALFNGQIVYPNGESGTMRASKLSTSPTEKTLAK